MQLIPRAVSLSGMFRQGSWAVTDQALSSVTNLALSVVIAHESSRSAFGAYTLAFSAYVVALALYRAITTIPLMIRFASRPAAEQEAQAPACLGLTLIFSLGFLALLLIPGLALSGPVRPYFVVMGCCMPGLLFQDCWRMQMYAASRPAQAVVLDAVWAVLQAITYVFLLSRGASGAWFLGAWGISATFSGCVYSALRHNWPNLRDGLRYFQTHRTLALNLAGEQAAYAGTINLVPYVLTGIVGLAGVGALRAAQVILGFLNIPLQGLSPLFTRHAVRLQHKRSLHLPRHLMLIASGGTTLIAGYGAVVLVLPARVGTLPVGDNWGAAHPLLLATTIAFAAQWLIASAFIGLRARAEAQTSFWIRLIGSVLILVAATAGGLIRGTGGAADGIAFASVGSAILAWAVIAPRMRRAAATPEASVAFDDDLSVSHSYTP